MIGGGVAGIEVALAFDARLRAAKRRGGVFVVGMQEQLAPGYPAFARALARHMHRRGISLLLGSAAAEVGADRIILENGTSASISEAVVATGVQTWEGLSDSGLVVDEGGFVEINRKLQSISHPEVFATGDCAHLDLAAGVLRKAGVYAVRQAPLLAANLAAAMGGGGLQEWDGGGEALAIVSDGLGGRDRLSQRPHCRGQMGVEMEGLPGSGLHAQGQHALNAHPGPRPVRRSGKSGGGGGIRTPFRMFSTARSTCVVGWSFLTG